MQTDTKATTNAIQVFCTPQGWMARYVGPHAKAIRDLFDTDVLPLPWTRRAKASQVVADLASRNPGVRVLIGGAL